MFTGIIEELGHIQAIQKERQAMQLVINAQQIVTDLHIGDSIAVNGVCLTVISFTTTYFKADIMPETVKATTLHTLQRGDVVNLERAMLENGRFGGHFVSGHIDEVGIIKRIKPVANAVYIDIAISSSSSAFCFERGSIAVDGISLTLFRVQGLLITLSLIPHTYQQTTLGQKRVGDGVNIETDLLGKHVAQQRQQVASTITADFLQRHGF